MISFDAEPEFLDMIPAGRLVASGMQQPFLMGETAVTHLIDHLRGIAVPKKTLLPVLAISGKNIAYRLPEIRRNVLGGEITIYVADDVIREAQRKALQGTLIVESVTTIALILVMVIVVRRFFVRPLQVIAHEISTRDADGIPSQPLPPQPFRELELLSTSVNDMTRLIRDSHDALNREHTRLAHVIEGTNVGVWEWNVQSGETRFNERWAEIVGYTLDELEPVSIETWMNLAHPDDLSRSRTMLEEHFAGKRAYYTCEARMRHKDGHWVWVLDRGKVASWTDAGKPLLMFGTHQDVTAQKEQALRLADSESRFRSLFEKNSSVMLLIDPVTGRIEDANRAAEAFYGYTHEELVNLHIEQINTLDPEQVATARQRALRQEKTTFQFKHRLSNGQIRDVEVKSTPIEVDNAVTSSSPC